jgi:hypothetical protein
VLKDAAECRRMLECVVGCWMCPRMLEVSEDAGCVRGCWKSFFYRKLQSPWLQNEPLQLQVVLPWIQGDPP